MERQIADGLIPPDLKEKISFVLLRKHRHQTKKPIHRSLADIGKSSNTTSSELRPCQRGEKNKTNPQPTQNPPFPSNHSPIEEYNPINSSQRNSSSVLTCFSPSSSSAAVTWSDRSPQSNLNRSTSSASGIHRSTEDLRSRQSSSLGRLRESSCMHTHTKVVMLWHVAHLLIAELATQLKF